VKWRIVRQPPDPATPAIELTEAFPNIPLSPGSYLVEARLGLAQAQQTIEVTGTRPTRATIPLNAGAIEFDPSSFRDTASSPSAVVSIEEQPERGAGQGRVLWLGTVAAAEVIVPAGTYKIVVQDRQFRTEKLIAVPSGSQGTPLIAQTAGRIRLQARDSAGGVPSGIVLLSVLEDDPTDPTGRREIARTAANRAEFSLPAGTYHIVARKGAAEVRELVALRPGEDVTKTLTLGMARLALSVRLAASSEPISEQVAFRIARLDEPAREIARADEAATEVELPPGRYRVENRIGTQNAVVYRDVELKAGVDQSIAFDQAAAVIRLKLTSAPGGATIPDVSWEVRDSTDETVWRATESEPRGILAAGRYKVRAETRDKRLEKMVDIKAGEAKTLEFTIE
jgi:Ca-activated chloride channel family protein